MSDAEFDCKDIPFERLVDGTLSNTHQRLCESHLDQCERCCQRLGECAASRQAWRKAREFLASMNEDANGCMTDAVQDGALQEDQNNEHGGLAEAELLDPPMHPNRFGPFPGYEVDKVIGKGGMGIVLKAFDPASNRCVAIKVLSPHYANDEAARKRFAREAKAASAIVHDNVLAIHQVCDGATETALPWLVMPLVDGESLQDRLERSTPMSEQEVVRIAIQVARGLAAAHAKGLVHRDIKPANLLLPREGDRVLIADFGLAQAADDITLTRNGAIVGTPQFMSPEQARGESLTYSSDLFSLGSVMYFMGAGVPPFQGETPWAVLRKIIEESPRPLRSLNPNITPWLEHFITALLSKRVDQRPTSAKVVEDTLRQYLQHQEEPSKYACPPIPKGTTERQQSSSVVMKPTSTATTKVQPFLLSIGISAMLTTIITIAVLWFDGSGTTDKSSSGAKSLGTLPAAAVTDTPKPIAKTRPQVLKTEPSLGAVDVAAGPKFISITFDRPMGSGMSWTGGGPSFPPIIEGQKPHWVDSRTCVLPAQLKPATMYRIGINSKSHQNFRSTEGKSVPPTVIAFVTEGAAEEVKSMVQRPRMIQSAPLNGDDKVDPDLDLISVTFDRPMSPGMSWTGREGFPKTPKGSKPKWSSDKKTCTLPVTLAPNTVYRIGLNGQGHINFQSQTGVPLEPTELRFQTR